MNQNPQFQAKVIEDTKCLNGLYDGSRITTLQLVYPRFIHAEFMTHRVFSRNASSSRAVPVAKMIEQVRNNPAMPIHWGENRPGMQARAELADPTEAIQSWKRAARQAADIAEHMAMVGLHKQVANRVLEPYQLMHVVVTATDWNNFFELRDHEAAQPEIRLLAQCMREAMDASKPRIVQPGASNEPEHYFWHLPYALPEERDLYRMDVLVKLSTARCARVSFINHDGTDPVVAKDVGLHDTLVASKPIHASPAEHQARASSDSKARSGNLGGGWQQYRKFIETARPII